jgi:YD repeat-containing protein
MSNTNTSTQQLGIFGWNFSFVGDIKIVADNDGNATILNSELQSILPDQLPGTALYDTSNSGLPLDELISSPYRLYSQQLLRQYSDSKRMFKKQADGSYQGESGTLTWNVNHYELQGRDGSLIVFRPDGQLNYIEDSNGYRLTASYTSNLLTKLSASNGDSFNLSYNTQGRIATVTDQRGQINTYTYDSTGQYLLSIKDPNGTTSFSYDNPYDPTIVTSVTYGDGRQVNYDYDAFGRLQQVIYGKGRQALAYTYTYDNNGGVTVADFSGASIKQLLNDQGEISQTIDPLGRTTNYIYDAAGNLVSVNSELGFSTSFTYDSNVKFLLKPTLWVIQLSLPIKLIPIT